MIAAIVINGHQVPKVVAVIFAVVIATVVIVVWNAIENR